MKNTYIDKRLLIKTFPIWLLTGVMLAGLLVVPALFPPQQVAASSSSSPIPTLAYYYIWFNSNSWDNNKIDSPILGKYTSDDRAVMRQHIQWAKEAGISGFIVSWKSTDVLNRRLEQLIEVSNEEDFKLAIIFEALDYFRVPLPIEEIASGFDYFIQNYSENPAFKIFEKPMLIWSGTWNFSVEDIATVTKDRRDSVLILASEHDIDRYDQLADSIDGNAYYWSSINPVTYPTFGKKLVKMSDAVHEAGGLWIAPAAPGFDARKIGGKSIVERKSGETLRIQVNAAMKSSPDALGIISWNEFSENTYVEPSDKYGFSTLNVVSELNNLPPPQIGEFDSSEPVGAYPEVVPYSRWIALGGISLLIIGGSVAILRRRR